MTAAIRRTWARLHDDDAFAAAIMAVLRGPA